MQIKILTSENGRKAIKFLLRKTDGAKVFLYKLFREGRVLKTCHALLDGVIPGDLFIQTEVIRDEEVCKPKTGNSLSLISKKIEITETGLCFVSGYEIEWRNNGRF